MNHPKGFTLIELVVVLAVIAVLVGISVPVMGSVMAEARISRAKADVNVLAKAILKLYEHTAFWPSDNDIDATANWTEPRNALAEKPPNNYPGWKGPYITQITDDPWGSPYHFDGPGHDGTLETGRGQVSVMSYGPDKLNNGSRDNPNRQSLGDDIAYFFR